MTKIGDEFQFYENEALHTSDQFTSRYSHPKKYPFCMKRYTQIFLIRKTTYKKLNSQKKLRNSNTGKIYFKKPFIFKNEILNIVLLYFLLFLVSYFLEGMNILEFCLKIGKASNGGTGDYTKSVSRVYGVRNSQKTPNTS